MSAWAIVVAAGRGTRAGLGRNKVYYRIENRSVLSICLDAFAASGLVEGIVLVISRDDRAEYDAVCAREGACPLVKRVVYGGATRRESVYNGLLALPEAVDIVAVHDAARPFVSREVIAATLESARRYGSGVISTRIVDTVKQLSADGSVSTLDRESLRAVQTPQAFARAKLLEAHARAAADLPATDDAALFEHCFGSVRLVTAKGSEENIKLTTHADFEALDRRGSGGMRIGQGYDAHRLKAGRRLVLCGVEVPFERGLDGHSDADVAVHALMDALLGAMGEGDIGRHFPDSDPAYAGISSLELLRRVMDLAARRGFSVVNADVTIVAQRPKLADYLAQMRENLAMGLGVGVECVNVKATTTEHMGFEGEEQGISAHAVCLLSR